MSFEIEQFKPAIARVVASNEVNKTGTGFYIGNGYVVTALHVVSDFDKSRELIFAHSIILNFCTAKKETSARIVEGFWSQDDDWVVLQCEDSLIGIKPIEFVSINDYVQEKSLTWCSFGYPAITADENDGMAIRGEIELLEGKYDENPAIQLSCKQAGTGAPLNGLSGAPCIIDGKAIGLLRSQLLTSSVDGQMERKVFSVAGTAYATPTKMIIDWQANRGIAILSENWAPPNIVSQEFLIFLSQQEGQSGSITLRSVADKAYNQLGAITISKPFYQVAADIIASEQNMENCIKALCRAKVVVFDATGFEPAIMFLAGIRSVVKRGVTILSVGGDYALGDQINVPFNITDANIVAHSKKQNLSKMTPSVMLLASRIRRGLMDIKNIRYLDLPVYDVIRRLPPDQRGVIPDEEGVLVLCPFAKHDYLQFWEQNLKPALDNGLEELRQEDQRLVGKVASFGVSRSFELNSARIVTQAIYEAIRRFNTCVIDLTYWSANVLFELGVRLAVTPTDRRTVCIIETTLKFIDHPANWKDQMESFVKLFVSEQFIYDKDKDWVDEKAFSSAYSKTPTPISSKLLSGGVHSIVTYALDIENEPASRPVYQDLLDEAETFSKFAGQAGKSKPVSIFKGNQELVAKEEKAAFERLFAAWLYLYNRFKSSSDDILKSDREREICSLIVDALLERYISLLNDHEIESLGDMQDKIEEWKNHV
jgi:hypothetical protein